MVHEEIDELITIKNNITEPKKKLEQLEIKYLLCNTSDKKYTIEITKKLNQWRIKNTWKKMDDMNTITMELQNNTK